MRIYIPIITLGFLIFILPFLNLPPNIEGAIISILGFLVLIIVLFTKILEIEERPKDTNPQSSLFNENELENESY